MIYCFISSKPKPNFIKTRWEQAVNIAKAQEIAVNRVGVSLDQHVAQMVVSMLVPVRCVQRIVANTYSRCQSHSACHSNVLEMVPSKMTTVQQSAPRRVSHKSYAAAMETFTHPFVNWECWIVGMCGKFLKIMLNIISHSLEDAFRDSIFLIIVSEVNVNKCRVSPWIDADREWIAVNHCPPARSIMTSTALYFHQPRVTSYVEPIPRPTRMSVN